MSQYILKPFLDYTDKFIDAMKNWKVPESNGLLRESAENKIKELLTEEYIVKATTITVLEDGDIGLAAKVGKLPYRDPYAMYYNILAFMETPKYTLLLWNFSSKESSVILREIESRPLKLKELYEEFDTKYSSKQFW